MLIVQQKAESLYQAMTKKKAFTADPEFWHGYASFLMDTLSPPSPTRARALLQRATQSVPSAQHRYLTQKFAALEFKSENGDAERGRTIFEGLVSTYPKKGDVWDVYIDLERSHGTDEQVRALYERAAKAGGKSKRIATVYKKWAEWESSNGNAKGVERVKALAEQWREEKGAKDDE
jgi:rRNA biogenesis protein RRP5